MDLTPEQFSVFFWELPKFKATLKDPEMCMSWDLITKDEPGVRQEQTG